MIVSFLLLVIPFNPLYGTIFNHVSLKMNQKIHVVIDDCGYNFICHCYAAILFLISCVQSASQRTRAILTSTALPMNFF